MKKRYLCVLTITLAMACSAAFAQSTPDISGLWDGPYMPDLSRALPKGETIPFTPYGAEKYKNVDAADNPNGKCLPPGPARAIGSPSPFEIVQGAKAVSILFENHGVYRIIYLDGRSHPEDVVDYPYWMGHSIGKWEGDTLVVDTYGIHERTWLDTSGHEHSAQLRLTERFQKVDNDTIKWTVTYNDPEFFTRPWSVSADIKRQKETRLLSYACMENEKDLIHLKETTVK